jgi:hypothetical protein
MRWGGLVFLVLAAVFAGTSKVSLCVVVLAGVAAFQVLVQRKKGAA